MGNLLKQPFEKYVREQIEVRQEVHGRSQNRSPEEISYLNSRNAWVRLSSAIWLESNRINYLKSKNGQSNPLMDGVGGDEDLAKKYVLFNGLSESNFYQKVVSSKSTDNNARAGITSPSNPNGAYGVGGTDFGYSPMPGIINANIKDLNRGSLKEATVNIKVQNKNQFDIIETLYMRIGYYILLEWGVNKYLTKEGDSLKLVTQIPTLGDIDWWRYKAKVTEKTPKLLDAVNSEVNKVLKDIEKYRKLNKGNYDALFGVITNFSWTFNTDGSYDIALRINSIGDVIESLKVNSPALVKETKPQPTPQAVGDFETLKKLYQDDPVPQQAFYDVLYPGLKQALQEYYKQMKATGFHNVFGGVRDVGTIGTVFETGNGYNYMFDKGASWNPTPFNFRPFYKNQDLTLNYISPPDISPELQDNQSIVDEILKDPSIGTLDLGTGGQSSRVGYDQYTSAAGNWVTAFFRTSIENIDETYKDVILVKRVSGPYNPNQPFSEGNGSNRTSFITGEGNNKAIVDLFFAPIEGKNAITFQSQNEVVNRRRIVGQEDEVTIEDSGDGQIRGWGGYDDSKQNKLMKLGKGYGAQAAGALWPGVKNGWFYLHDGFDELMRGGDFVFDTAPPLEEGPIALYEITRETNDDTNPKTILPFPDNKVLSELIFFLCTEEMFLTYVYNLFVEADQAGGDDDPRFELPEEDEITEEVTEVTAYETELEEKRNKNAIFNWFYTIRKLYPLYTYQAVNSTYNTTNLIGQEKSIRNILDTSLDTLPKIALFSNKQNDEFMEIGRIINPFDHEFKTPSSFSKPATENLQDAVKADLRDLDESPTVVKDSTNPQDAVNILKNAAATSGKPLSPPQTGLIDIINLAYQEPSEKVKEWNSKIGFPNYTLSKSRDFAFLFVSPISNAYYVRLGVLLDFLEQKVVFTVDNKSPVINFDTNQKTNICYTIDNVISTNITKCLIANPNFYTETFGQTPQYTSIFNNLESFVDKIDGFYYGKIMNIYFSFSRVEQILQAVDTENKVDLFTFLKAITDDINECTGNITNIEPIIDKSTNTIKFIDSTTIPGLEQIAKALGYGSFDQKDVTLEVFGYNQRSKDPKSYKSSFVRNINLKTEISKEYASMITIGATANGAIPGSEATALSKWNVGIHDRFKPIPSGSFEEQYKLILTSYANLITKEYARCGLNFPEKDTDYVINYDYISSAQDIMSNYYKYAQAESMQNYLEDKNAIVESSMGFIPFNLGIEMDGISGIKIYNRVTVNTSFLPSNYGDSLDFVVSQVNHKIENNQWITNLETIATSKYKDGS